MTTRQCPTCGYTLSSSGDLAQSRCPECGLHIIDSLRRISARIQLAIRLSRCVAFMLVFLAIAVMLFNSQLHAIGDGVYLACPIVICYLPLFVWHRLGEWRSIPEAAICWLVYAMCVTYFVAISYWMRPRLALNIVFGGEWLGPIAGALLGWFIAAAVLFCIRRFVARW